MSFLPKIKLFILARSLSLSLNLVQKKQFDGMNGQYFKFNQFKTIEFKYY